MSTRFATLIIASFLALTANVALAKVSPTLDAQQENRDQVLQQLINQPRDGNSCDAGRLRDLVAPADTVGVVTSGANGLCPIPAPPANPFGNVASL